MAQTTTVSWTPSTDIAQTHRTLQPALHTGRLYKFLVFPTRYVTKKDRRHAEGPGWYCVDSAYGSSNLWLAAPVTSEWTSTTLLTVLCDMRAWYGPHVPEAASITVKGPNWHDGYDIRYTVEELGGAKRLQVNIGNNHVGSEADRLPESLRFWLEHLAAAGPLTLSECGKRLTPILPAAVAT